MFEDTHQELFNISEWMKVNKVSLIPKTTEFMMIGHPFRNKNLDFPDVLMLDSKDITKLDQAKYLGVIMNKRLTWDEHLRLVKGY